MAKTTIIHIIDDIDGADNATEVAFSYKGVDYTIDLSKKNAAAMEKALKPYLDAATKVSRRGSSPKHAKASLSATPRKDLAAIREWARARGIEVSDRGRVPATIIEQYDAAH